METKEQKEERRLAAGLNNPKKDWWARRKSQGKWIGGRFLSAEDLMEARKWVAKEAERIKAKMKKWYYRIFNWFKRLWRKLFGGMTKGN